MKVSDLKTSDLTLIYIQLRDRRAQRKAAYEAEDAADKAKQEKIEGVLLAKLDAEGSDSVRTANGTAYKSKRISVSVADWDSFFPFVQQTEAWHMLEHRASKTAVEQYVEENADLPPGLNWSETITLNVRRS